MNINIKIEKLLKKPKFLLNEYEFIIKLNSTIINKGLIIGNVKAESNDKRKKIFYKIINKTINFIDINSLTGELFISNDNSLINNISLIIEASYLLNDNENLKSFIKIKIYFRSLIYLNNLTFNIEIQSPFIKQQQQEQQQLNNSMTFFINKNVLINENLFKLNILSNFYQFDKFILLLDNYYSTFLIQSYSQLNNEFLIKLINNINININTIYLLNFHIKHQITNEILNQTLTIKLIIIDSLINTTTQLSLISSSSDYLSKNSLLLNNICYENLTYFLYDLSDNKNHIGKLKVFQTNKNISIFSNFFLLINQSEFIINQCRMLIDQFDYFYLNQTQYKLCSIDNICFNISSNNQINSFLSLFNLNNYKNNLLLYLKPIEITIFILFLIFILSIITLILIICRLKGFHLCLTIKNYLFYGKKYGLNHAQRLSTNKINVNLFFSFYFKLFILF